MSCSPTWKAPFLSSNRAPDDAELIGKVFRVMHTIKGSGAMFGFDDIAEFTHGIETVYDRVRSGQHTRIQGPYLPYPARRGTS